MPEIVEYKVRRELLLAERHAGVARLAVLTQQLDYLPITTLAMRLAAI